jgi:hypothetical protein
MPLLHTPFDWQIAGCGWTQAIAGQMSLTPLHTACHAAWLLAHSAFDSAVLAHSAQ